MKLLDSHSSIFSRKFNRIVLQISGELNALFLQPMRSPNCQIEILFLHIYIGHHSYPSTSFREKGH